ncbi:hypothetical protein VDG1235_1649 [Verrucomicrobiia bacterium DG1235]|nr:hypothetical protein VDG1235_1649 [Verrucomicrobiae bacterium DG1235]
MRLEKNALLGDSYFTWRGVSTSRLESLSDIVFGFSITLLVVSLEVPHSFDELTRAFMQLPAFAFCFFILALFWFYNYQFHRRFGLQDNTTIVLTIVQLFLVLFYIYPLKFFFTWISETYMSPEVRTVEMAIEEVPAILILYGSGWTGVFLLFGLLYRNAYSKRALLELDSTEAEITRLCEIGFFCSSLVGLLSVLIAVVSLLLSITSLFSVAGFVYLLYGPISWYTDRRVKLLQQAASQSDYNLGDGI